MAAPIFLGDMSGRSRASQTTPTVIDIDVFPDYENFRPKLKKKRKKKDSHTWFFLWSQGSYKQKAREKKRI